MTPDQAKSQLVSFLREIGEDVTVRRYVGAGPDRAAQDVATRARVMGYQPKDLIGSIAQGDRRGIFLSDDVAVLLPLTVSDKVVIRDRECAIKAIDDNTRRIAGILIGLDLQVAG